MDKALLRNIPKVDELLAPTHALCPDATAAAVTAAVRRTLDALRESVLSGEAPEIPETAALCALAAALLATVLDSGALRRPFGLFLLYAGLSVLLEKPKEQK